MSSYGYRRKRVDAPPPKFNFADFRRVDWDAAWKHAKQFEKPVKATLQQKMNGASAWITEVVLAKYVPGIEITLWRKYGNAHGNRESFMHSQGVACCTTISRSELMEAKATLKGIVADVAKDNMHLLLLLPSPVDGTTAEILDSRLLFRISIADYNKFLPESSDNDSSRDM